MRTQRMTNITDNQIELTGASDHVEIEEVCRFRAAVWMATDGVDPAAFPCGSWRDPIDDVAQHWVCRDARGTLLAACRLTIHDRLEEIVERHEYQRYGIKVLGAIAAPDRVVVAPAAQGQGLASRLLDMQHAAARAAGAACALRQASPRMVRLLERRGWRLHGPAGIDRRFPGVPFEVASYTFAPNRVRFDSPQDLQTGG